jgi:hypothetical protein
MMNAGLSALMPGQAAPNMAGVLPPPSQAAPNAVPSHVDALARLPFEQLQALYRDPPKEVPAYAVIAARDKQIRDAQTRKAYQDMMAQQQVAGQRGTVADNVMGMDTVYAANGGEMRVQGFQFGGAPRAETLFPVDGVELFRPREGPERGESRDEYEARKRREAEEADEVANRPLRRVYRAITDYFSTPANERLPILDAIIQGRSRGLPAAAQAVQQPTPSTTPAVSPAAQRRAAQVSGRRGQAAAPLEEAPPSSGAGLGAGADALAGAGRTPPPVVTQQRQQSQVPTFDIDTLTSAIEQAGIVPPEILEERKALAAARKAQLERQQAAAERYKAGLEESPEDRRMRAFAAIAKGLSSSPRLSAALSELVGSETEARRARREGMKEVMTLEDAAANLQIAMQEQALADRTNDNKLKTAAAVAVAQAQQAYQKALFEQGIAAREVGAKEVAARNTGISRSSSTDNTLLRERADALSKRIETLAEKANPLSPYSQEEKKKAREQMEVLQAQLDRLLGLAPAAPTAASGSRIREVLVVDPATGLLVPKPQP